MLALPLAVAGGLVFANSQARSFVCPVTGEVLPCEKCCPLNDFTCPLTGEPLPCPKCCPLNHAN